ncbi:NADPH-dependent F420 reductase [Streptomyces cathayae]|uniref:NADPH-dependent F420 reductase n=1 Tax=Streptomyces cathayae TaxID=3031124 RepID=A0ABY8K6E1_9ACTN|nr:NADPH-dependent F420 reductase [Streptomyces sp. HUAS 5]WGD43263.1 NADPH-dependent F420 reductase [Streptomyces sp. HUAS 5]
MTSVEEQRMIVTIVGAGNMARGIGTRALAGGHSVRLHDRGKAKAEELATALSQATPGADATAVDAEAAADADIVVLALPCPAGRDVAVAWAGTLAGKVVVDISNPVDFSTFDSLVVPPGTSAAEQIAAAVPESRVVKAFNTTFAGTLTAGEVAGRPLDVFIAGDDEAAKQTVADLVSSAGLRPLDVGPLRRARELEAFQFLHMASQERLGLNWSSAIAILP